MALAHPLPSVLQSHIESGHVGARVRRWARCMERSSAVGSFDNEALVNGHTPNGNATWQELLRRYAEPCRISNVWRYCRVNSVISHNLIIHLLVALFEWICWCADEFAAAAGQNKTSCF